MTVSKIFLGNDHAGQEYVQNVKKYLESKGFEVEHLGTFTDESVDYPEFGEKVGRAVISARAENPEISDTIFGIVICGTGIGISISANKVSGVICANCRDAEMAKLAREHNNANIVLWLSTTVQIKRVSRSSCSAASVRISPRFILPTAAETASTRYGEHWALCNTLRLHHVPEHHT